jgi:hypothetical protein
MRTGFRIQAPPKIGDLQLSSNSFLLIRSSNLTIPQTRGSTFTIGSGRAPSILHCIFEVFGHPSLSGNINVVRPFFPLCLAISAAPLPISQRAGSLPDPPPSTAPAFFVSR